MRAGGYRNRQLCLRDDRRDGYLAGCTTITGSLYLSPRLLAPMRVQLFAHTGATYARPIRRAGVTRTRARRKVGGPRGESSFGLLA